MNVSEIVANSAKVTTALKLSQQDQETIASLKKEIEKVKYKRFATLYTSSVGVYSYTKLTANV